MDNQRRKDWRKNDSFIIFLALKMFILKVGVELLGLGIIQDFQVQGSV